MSTHTDVSSLSAIERWRRALRALANVVANPAATDQVLVFGTHANAGTMHRRLRRFFADPDGQRLFDERRAIDAHTVDLERLRALPAGTLGHAYAEFLRIHHLAPDVFAGPPDGVTDPRASYFVQRLRQTHDLWHVMTSHDTDPAGEIALLAFTFGQIRTPSTLILSMLATLRHVRDQPGLAKDVARAFLAGRAAKQFVTFPWEDHWATPLAELRARLGVSETTVRSAPRGGWPNVRSTAEPAAAYAEQR